MAANHGSGPLIERAFSQIGKEAVWEECGVSFDPSVLRDQDRGGCAPVQARQGLDGWNPNQWVVHRMDHHGGGVRQEGKGLEQAREGAEFRVWIDNCVHIRQTESRLDLGGVVSKDDPNRDADASIKFKNPLQESGWANPRQRFWEAHATGGSGRQHDGGYLVAADSGLCRQSRVRDLRR